MIQEKINKIIPFLNENFITYPLWEEGKYIPFVNFWQMGNDDFLHELDKKIDKVFDSSGYLMEYYNSNYTNTIHQYRLYPEFKELKNGSYKFVKQDWSIEEMLDLLVAVLK